MAQYIIIAVGPHTPNPTETVVPTATEGIVQLAAQRRLCGRSGTVEVFGLNGRKVTDDTLMNAAAEEASGREPRKKFEPNREGTTVSKAAMATPSRR